MSVVSIINTGDAVHMFTDGGLFNRGVVERITNKVRAFPHLNAAFAFRSSVGWWPLFIERVGYSFESFDDVVDGIAEFFREGITSITAGHELHGEELWFCGWSDQRQRFDAYGISSRGLQKDVHGIVSKPWALTRIDGNLIVPIDSTFYSRLQAFPANTIEERGVAIAECQRQVVWENAHGDDEILVGGHIQLTTVTKDMISQKILKTWPDKGVKVSFFDTSAPVSALSADTGSGGTKGLVPRPEAGDAAAGKFLKADGTWSAPAARGHIFGLTLANNAADATNDIDIAAGEAASDDTSSARIILASALTKRLDAAWAVGSGNGGLDTGSIANATYHVWLIKRPDTGVVDVLYSTSATSPTMPANYTLKRRIGSVMRSSGALIAFVQIGDKFLLKTPDYTSGSTTTSASLITLASFPTGLKLEPIIAVWNLSGTAISYLSSPDVNDQTPSASASPGFDVRIAGSGSASTETFLTNHLMTDTSARLRHRSSATDGALQVATRGWVDVRGRLG